MDQASQVAVRRLILPTSWPCSFVPSVTTPPLYRTSVSRTLRRPIRIWLYEQRPVELIRSLFLGISVFKGIKKDRSPDMEPRPLFSYQPG
jgi:hypothetical protein